jgi:hypothetical protein
METLITLKDDIMSALGMKQPELKPFESQKPKKVADRDSLRWFQSYYNQWDDERQRNALIANIVRDDTGFIKAIGFAHHPVNANFAQLPATINAVPMADRQNWASTPEFLRNHRMTLWTDDRQLGSDKTY